MRSWNIKLFVSDIDNMGGVKSVAKRFDMRIRTLQDYYDGKRVPNNPMSLAGLAVDLGFPHNRYY